LHVRERELNSGSLHAEIRSMLHLFIDMRRHQQLFGGDTATQSTRAAQPFVFFDNRDFQTQLSGANRGHITARSAANHRHIELFVSQLNPLSDTIAPQPRRAGIAEAVSTDKF
jgi:hypothetical protein